MPARPTSRWRRPSRSVLRALADGRRSDRERLDALPTAGLAALLLAVAKDGDRATVADGEYLRALGLPDQGPLPAGEVWRGLLDRHLAAGRAESDPWRPALRTILDKGPLARRLLRALGEAPSREALRATYRALADDLLANRQFHA